MIRLGRDLMPRWQGRLYGVYPRPGSLTIRPYDPAINYFEDNPFHLVALETARMVKVRFILNVVQDIHKQIMGAVAGDLKQAHLDGVESCGRARRRFP